MAWMWTDDLAALQAYLAGAALLLEPRRNAASGELVGGPPLVWDEPQRYQDGWIARQHPDAEHTFAMIDPVFSE